MASTLKDILSKAQPITLDRPRNLMLTNYAWMFLEEAYSSMAGALRGYAEMMSGQKTLTHATIWLWALLQEEIREANKQRRPGKQETLTREDVERLIVPADVREYQSRIADTITAYYPTPDPLTPAPRTESPGTGGGSTSSSGVSTAGPETNS